MDSITPYYNNHDFTINHGIIYKANTFCLKKYNKTCEKYYQKIKEEGIYTCPYGFNSIATRFNIDNGIIYSSLVIKELINSKVKGKSNLTNKFSKEIIERLISLFEIKEKQIVSSMENIKNEENIIRGLSHEVRKLSSNIEDAESILAHIENNLGQETKNILLNIIQAIKLIKIRVESYEMFKNPTNAVNYKQYSIPVYKKFDKARYILTQAAREKNIHIHFKEESTFTITGYDVFDLVPYILIENAVKYSVDDSNINVLFDDTSRTIIIENVGPKLTEEDKASLGNLGFRAISVRKIEGSGLGLYLLKQICAIHNIDCVFESEDHVCKCINSIEYSLFKVKLKFV